VRVWLGQGPTRLAAALGGADRIHNNRQPRRTRTPRTIWFVDADRRLPGWLVAALAGQGLLAAARLEPSLQAPLSSSRSAVLAEKPGALHVGQVRSCTARCARRHSAALGLLPSGIHIRAVPGVRDAGVHKAKHRAHLRARWRIRTSTLGPAPDITAFRALPMGTAPTLLPRIALPQPTCVVPSRRADASVSGAARSGRLARAVQSHVFSCRARPNPMMQNPQRHRRYRQASRFPASQPPSDHRRAGQAGSRTNRPITRERPPPFWSAVPAATSTRATKLANDEHDGQGQIIQQPRHKQGSCLWQGHVWVVCRKLTWALI